jgi:signal transduction histidine kinase
VANVQIPVVAGQAQAAPTSVCVMEDSRGLIWQGSMSGCCVYNPVSGWQKLLDMNSGLFGSSVVGIVEDHRHTMWIVTEHGVSNVTPQKEEDGTWSFLVHSFGTKDGLQQGPYNQRSVSVTHDGKVLIGGFNGLDIIDPKLVSSSANKERPIFSGLKLFGQQVEVGKEYDGHVILEEALDVCKELVLRHDENQFTIQLATDKGEAHNTSRFIYQLEGFSDKWIKTEEVDPNITYMSLHHGSYKLHVRMLNDDGTMGDYEATLEITITPPLIRNRWLMIAFLTLLAGGIFLWRRRFLKKHQERVELENYRNEIHKKHWMSAMKKKQHLKKGETDDEPEPQEAEDTEDQTEAGNTADDGVEYAEVEEVEAIDDQIESQATDEEEMALMAGGEKEKTDLLPLFREVCDAFKAPNGKSLRISYFPLDEHLEVMGDRAQLAYMLKILLTNSSRFAPANSTVKVFAERQAGNAVIRVIDKGVGIPDDVLSHLFEKIENDTEKTNLHLVAEIAKSHEGTVKGEGNIGGGTVFTITLPLIQA